MTIVVICTDWISRCKSNYHTITATMGTGFVAVFTIFFSFMFSTIVDFSLDFDTQFCWYVKLTIE